MMTEEKQQPEPQTNAADAVQKMVEAFELSETATSYTEGNSEVPPQVISENKSKNNPVLMRFIKAAEKQVIKEQQQLIIDKARGMISIEIDKIRGLLG
jgi:hypothetical protein